MASQPSQQISLFYLSEISRVGSTNPSVAQKAPFPRATKRQKSSKICVSKMIPQMSNLTIDESTKPQIFAEKMNII